MTPDRGPGRRDHRHGRGPATRRLPDSWYNDVDRLLPPANQFNSPMTFTISDSNLDDFSDAAVFVTPDVGRRAGRRRSPATPPRSRPAAALAGRARVTCTCTTTRSPTPARACTSTATTGNDTTGDSVYEAVTPEQHVLQRRLRHPDDRAAVQRPEQLRRRQRAGDEQHLRRLVADRRQHPGPGRQFSQLQYNLFYNNATNLVVNDQRRRLPGQRRARSSPIPISWARSGRPTTLLRENFELEPNSPAINAARSEIGPLPAEQRDLSRRQPDVSLAGGVPRAIRTDPTTVLPAEAARAAASTVRLASATSPIRARSSPCRARATSASPTSGRPS